MLSFHIVYHIVIFVFFAGFRLHRQRRTNDDKRKAVMTLLEDEEWSEWNNCEIGRRCGVSDEMVRGLRASLPKIGSDPTPSTRTYRDKHGNVGVMNVENIGRGPAERRRRCRAAVTVETVRAVVLAFAAGVIELEVPSGKSKENDRRNAPLFSKSDMVISGSSYDASTIRKFLGWKTRHPISRALQILEAEERELLDSSATDSISLPAAAELATASRRAEEKVREAAEQEAARGNAEGAKKLKKEAIRLSSFVRNRYSTFRDRRPETGETVDFDTRP